MHNNIIIPKEHKAEHRCLRNKIRELLKSGGGGSGSVDFNSLSEEDAIAIANSITDINAPSIRLRGCNVEDWVLALTGNGTNINLKDTKCTSRLFYMAVNFPIKVTAKTTFAPTLNNGEYISLAYGDSRGGANKIYKSITQGEVIANLELGAFLQLQKQDFGSDLILASAYNFTFDNQTNEDISYFMYFQYGGKNVVVGNTASVQPYTKWDYVDPYYSVDLRNATRNVTFELWKADMSQKIYTITKNAGSNYSGTNHMEEAKFSKYNTRDYKVIAKYQ